MKSIFGRVKNKALLVGCAALVGCGTAEDSSNLSGSMGGFLF